MLLQEIRYLVRKEIQLEWRQKYALSGVLVYVVSTVFVAYLSFRTIRDIPTWNALFWIILLFTAVNAIAKSFVQESGGQRLYLYSLCSPEAIILSKIIYNAMVVSLLAIICLAAYVLFIGNPVENMGMFLLCLVLGGTGFSSALTLISAISAQTSNNATLMAILSFPIILPMLILLIAFSKNAIDGLAWAQNTKYLIGLGAINGMVVVLSYLLFPYLWRD